MTLVLTFTIFLAFLICYLVLTRTLFSFLLQIEGTSLHRATLIDDLDDLDGIGVRYACFNFAAIISFIGTIEPLGTGWQTDLLMMSRYAGLILLALLASHWSHIHSTITWWHRTARENGTQTPASSYLFNLLQGSGSIMTAFIIRGALDRWSAHPLDGLLWFAIGLILATGLTALPIFLFTHFTQAIQTANLSLAYAYAGFLLSVGLIVGHAISGQSTTLSADLEGAGITLLGWLVLLASLYFIINRSFGQHHRLQDEIVTDQNIGAGLLLASSLLGATLFYIELW